MGDWQTLLYRNRLILVLAITIIVVAGVASYITIPKLEDPVIINRYAVVITNYPGATAERVESTITEQVENTIQELSEIKELNSSSRPGISVVNIELAPEITNPDPVWSKVRDRLRRIESTLPPGAGIPLLDEERGYPFTKLIAIQTQNNSVPNYALQRYATELKRILQRYTGTDLVRIFGNSTEEVLIDVNIHKLNALGLNIAQLSQLIRSADSKVPAGQIYHTDRNVALELQGEFVDIDRIKRIPIASAEGQIIRLDQIAEVRPSLRDPPTNLSRVNGYHSVVIATRILPGQKIDSWAKGIDKILEDFQKQLPSNVKLVQFFDQNDYTTKRLANLRNNLLTGAALVAIILLLTLGYRAAIIVSVTLPIVMLCTIAMLDFFGYALHQISIIGIIVALGLVVDNAIVMVSAIQRKLISGLTVNDAIHQVVGNYWAPLLSSTVTTILAFMPILLTTGPMGEFVSPLAAAVIYSLIASYVVSIFIVPSVTGIYLSKIQQNKSWYNGGLRMNRLEKKLKSLLGWGLKNRSLTYTTVILTPLLALWCSSQLINQFFPRADRNQFYIELFMPQQTSIYKTDQLTKEIAPLLEKIPEISSIQWFVGQSAPAYYYNRILNRDGSPQFAEALINTKSLEDPGKIIPKIQVMLNEKFPQAQIIVRDLWQGVPFNAPIEIRLSGPDLQQLYDTGNDLRVILQDLPGVTQTNTAITFGAPKLLLATEEEKLKTLGITLNDVAQDINRQFDGVISGSLLQGPEELPVRVRASTDYRAQFSSVEDYIISNGQEYSSYEIGVPFSAIGKTHYRPSVANIARLDGERVNIINGYVEPTVLPQQPLDAFRAKLQELNYQLPYGYRLSFGGEEDKRGEAVENLMSQIGLIAVLMIATLILTFNSIRYMLIIVIVGILSSSFGLISLYVFNYPFGFVVIMALMGLIGVAINAGIIMISNLQIDPKANYKRLSSVRKVIMNESSRHIISTTLTTIVGFAPLLLTPGELWTGFAITFIGGITLTTIVSFFIVPSLYIIFGQYHTNSNPNKKSSRVTAS